MCEKCASLVEQHEEVLAELTLDISVKVATILGKSNPNMTFNERIAASTALTPYIVKWIEQMTTATADAAIRMNQSALNINPN